MEIKDAVVVITGASMGIGLAAARRFAEEGARVALSARSADLLEQAVGDLRAQGREALAVPADMRRQPDAQALIEATVERYGRIDILVNNAGQAAAGTVAELSPEDFHQILELNVFGPLYAIQAAVPRMRAAGGGLIINISSMVSKMHIPGLGAYAATKAALNMLSDTARGELEADHIRVITVYPRVTATDFGRNSLGNRGMRRQQRAGTHIEADTAEYVAEKIVLAARQEPAEQYMDR